MRQNSKSKNSSTPGAQVAEISITRTTYADEICEYLRQAIYSFALKPGEQINELDLMKKTGVSRSPIREAFRILEGQGLVERIQGKGIFVKAITPKQVEEIYAVRSVLEGLAAEQAVPNLKPSDVKRLENLVEEMEEAARAKDIDAALDLNYQFHRTITKAAKNSTIEAILKNLPASWRWFVYAGLLGSGTDWYIKSHRPILKAILKRDPKAVGRAMRKHILDAGKLVSESFRKSIE